MKWHPELLATLLDILVAADKPKSTSELSMAATTRMRKLVADGVVTNEQVMYPNYAGAVRIAYWEVTGSMVSALLKADDRVKMTGKRGNQNHWALHTRIAEWEQHSVAAKEARAAADARVEVRKQASQIEVVCDNRSVAAFFIGGLTESYAVELAEQIAKQIRVKLYRSLTKQEVWR